MQNQPRCMHCGGYRVTPRTSTAAGAGVPYLMYKTPGGGFFDQGVRLAWEGSACLDCGYVMLFLGPESLERARALPEFVPWGA